MTCCKAKDYSNWCKSEGLVYIDEAGNGYCIFHAPQGKKGVSPDEFNSKVFDKLNSGAEFVHLGGTIFEDDINFDRKIFANLPINFSKTTFSGKAIFSHAIFRDDIDFSHTTFKEGADFSSAKFNKVADFSNTIFDKEADFIKASFNGPTPFVGAKFNESSNFIIAEFRGEPFFHATTFNGKSNFAGAQFFEPVDFSETSFNDKTHFSQVKFIKEAAFSRVLFNGAACFSTSTFAGQITFRDAAFIEGADFHLANFDKRVEFYGDTFIEGSENPDSVQIDLRGLEIRDKARFEGVNLKHATFLDTDLRKIDFVNCRWPEKNGRRILYDEASFFEPKSKDTEEQPSKSRNILKKIELLYRRLKQKYVDEHDWYEVSNWHYSEKEMRRFSSFRHRYTPLSITWLYWASSGYGERPIRAFGMLLGIIVFFSLLLPITYIAPANDAPQWIFNLTTFSKPVAYFLNTLQYAAFQKNVFFEPASPAASILKTFAQIVIPIQTALFALAVRNKYRR